MRGKMLLVFTILCLLLTSCDLFNNNDSFDNDNLVQVEGKDGYYTDPNLSFCAEIWGSYKSDRPFILDSTNENLRIWDDVYLYENDYFQMIASGSSSIFYSVEDSDLEYVIIDEKYAQATVKDGKSGIYKIIFDLSTKLFDLEFKGEITTPVFEKMDGCDIYTLSYEFTELTVNPNNKEELMIENYKIQTGEIVSFYNHGNVHLSKYKVFLDEKVIGKYASALADGDRHISFLIGGAYNIYVNPTTYAVRIELVDAAADDYTLHYFNADGTITKLDGQDSINPYIFRYQVTALENDRLPIYCNSSYGMYELDVVESEYIDLLRRFRVAGVYDVEINLDAFTISVTYIPQ